MAKAQPALIVLAGPNGAGKSTSARFVLGETFDLSTFVNADTIAAGLSGFNPESMGLEAGRIMLRRLRTLAAQRADFAFETTLAGRAYVRWFEELRNAGYVISLVYVWVTSPDLAVHRVSIRVADGGHNIPEETIRQRYRRSLQNFFQLYRPIVTRWAVYDNSNNSVPHIIASGDEASHEVVVCQPIWQEMARSANE